MKYIPVIIPTCNRMKHLKNCLNSLKNNSVAMHTDIYISVDYPPTEAYFTGYYEVLDYLQEGIVGFNHVYVYIQKENLGVENNINFLYNKVYGDENYYILTEDDNYFSPYFLEYINIMIETYKEDEQVLAVCGYSYAFQNMKIAESNYFLDTYFSAWGYGISCKKAKEIKEGVNIDFFTQLYSDEKFMRKLRSASPNQYCYFIKGMLEYIGDLISDGKVLHTDLAYGIYMFSKGYQMIFPAVTLVRNMGYDGSGVNCGISKYHDDSKINHRNFDFSKQEVMEIKKLTKNECNSICSAENMREYTKTFFSLDRWELIKTDIMYWFSRVFGMKCAKRICKRIAYK